MKNYQRKGARKTIYPMRPYVLGERLKAISISRKDVPQRGGMIAHNPSNPNDRWYVSERDFNDNYELVA